MRIEASCTDGTMRLRLIGELDHHAAKAGMREIGEQIDVYLPRDCVLDLEDLTFMDSSGIAVILKTYKHMNGIGGRIRIENVRPQPLRVLDASGIERIIGIAIRG